MKTNKNDLFYICSLIESVSRESGNSKAEIVDILGEKKIKRLYKFAEVNHCLPIEQVTDEVINLNQINRKEKTKQKPNNQRENEENDKRKAESIKSPRSSMTVQNC